MNYTSNPKCREQQKEEVEITWIRIQLKKIYVMRQGLTNVFTLSDTTGQILSSVFTLSYPLFVNSPSEVKDTSWFLGSWPSAQATHLPLMLAVPHTAFMQGCFLQAGLKKS